MKGLVFILSILCLAVGCHAPPPQSVSQAITAMANCGSRGQFDKSIQVGEDWLRKHPEDGENSGTLFQQIALVYLMKASKTPAHTEENVGRAVDYLDRALAAARRKEVSLDLYEIGRGFELAGDITGLNKCTYYRRAVQAFEDQSPLLQGETVTAAGRTLPLASARRDNEKALAGSRAKLGAADCR